MKFVYNASCMYPLVRTVNEDSYYEDIDGCGIQCMNPLFTDTEHRSLHIFIGIVASLCLISTLITVVSFSQYEVVFYTYKRVLNRWLRNQLQMYGCVDYGFAIAICLWVMWIKIKYQNMTLRLDCCPSHLILSITCFCVSMHTVLCNCKKPIECLKFSETQWTQKNWVLGTINAKGDCFHFSVRVLFLLLSSQP